jgi:hypothetical protein
MGGPNRIVGEDSAVFEPVVSREKATRDCGMVAEQDE